MTDTSSSSSEASPREPAASSREPGPVASTSGRRFGSRRSRLAAALVVGVLAVGGAGSAAVGYALSDGGDHGGNVHNAGHHDDGD